MMDRTVKISVAELDELMNQLAELKQQRDELQRDAERYRWLRKKKAAPCDYDTAIDAAMTNKQTIGCIGHDGECCKDRDAMMKDAKRWQYLMRIGVDRKGEFRLDVYQPSMQAFQDAIDAAIAKEQK